MVIDSAKSNNLIPTKTDLIARMIYEDLQNNESISKIRMDESISKNAVRVMKRIDDGEILTIQEALAHYELAFKDVLSLQLTPIKKYEDIDKVRDQLWRSDDNLHDAKRAFMKLAIGNEDQKKSTLLNIRLRIREGFNKGVSESTVQNETKVHVTGTSTRERQFNPSNCQEGTFRTITMGDGQKGVICKKKGEDKTSLQTIIKKKGKKKEKIATSGKHKNVMNEDFLGEMQGKNRKEQLEILEEANPDIDKDILKDLIL